MSSWLHFLQQRGTVILVGSDYWSFGFDRIVQGLPFRNNEDILL